MIKNLKIKFENDQIFKNGNYSQMKSQVFHSVDIPKNQKKQYLVTKSSNQNRYYFGDIKLRY